MVGAFHPRILRLLQRIHQTRVATGPDTLPRHLKMGRSTFYRLQRHHHLHYYPNIQYVALGLVHAHLFITEATEDWLALPFAIERASLVNGKERSLYLHCLFPQAHATRLRDAFRARGATVILSADPSQALGDPPVDPHGLVPDRRTSAPANPPAASRAADPFLLLIALEAFGHRSNLDALWHRVYARLGKRVWQYLPRQRRWPHNGKHYVKRAFDQLNHAGLVSQHVVTYAPLRTRLVELLTITPPESLDDLRAQAALTLEYPTHDGVLVRALGETRLLKFLLTTSTDWWLIDDETTNRLPPVRFTYEALHDPATATWRIA